MKKNVSILNSMSFLLVIALLTAYTCNNSEKKAEYGEATKELIQMVKNDPEIKLMLTSSLEKSRQINPDKNTNPVQNLEDYYDFISYSETAMPWALLNKPEYHEIYDNMFQSLCYFYFLRKIRIYF